MKIAVSHRDAVGKGVDYDLIGGLQFRVLLAEGLREDHTVLDVGCGPLRLGRILIPWLRAGMYRGVDPDSGTVEQALEQEVGYEMVRRKNPVFRYSADFPFEPFGELFDYVIIHSVFIHMPLWKIESCLVKLKEVLRKPRAWVLFTFKEGEAMEVVDDWTYPEHVTHSMVDIVRVCSRAGFLPVMLNYREAENFQHQWVLAQ